MKEFLTSRIFTFILGTVIFSGITGVAAYNILANDIRYTPSDSSWKVDNVKDAIDDLYTKSNNKDNYNDKEYTTEGLIIHDDRITILDGGYYVDSNNTTWVSMKLKINKNLSGNDAWVLLYNLPTSSKQVVFTDNNSKYPFKFNYPHTSSFPGNITFFDRINTNSLSANEEVIIQFKY